MRRIVIVGGGISGLTAAYHLTRGPRPPQVTVLESGAAPGGWVGSAAIAGYRVDTGPEALLARMPAVQALLADLGLDEARRAPQGSAFIWARGALRPLPQSSVFGEPNKLMPLLRSGLVGPLGVLRAGADLVLPRPRRLPPDPTIAQVLLLRFGSQVFANMIEPLLGGVHAGDARRLSVRSAPLSINVQDPNQVVTMVPYSGKSAMASAIDSIDVEPLAMPGAAFEKVGNSERGMTDPIDSPKHTSFNWR